MRRGFGAAAGIVTGPDLQPRPMATSRSGEGEVSAAGNDDKSPLIDLIRCIVCNETMKLEKSSPDAEGMDILQYRCGLCDRIERVRLFRRSRDSTD